MKYSNAFEAFCFLTIGYFGSNLQCIGCKEIPPEIITSGGDLVWLYQSHNESYPLKSNAEADLLNGTPTRFSFIFNEASVLTNIKILNSTRIGVDTTGKLSPSSAIASFNLVPIQGFEGNFHLFFGNQSIVTARSKPPFVFHLGRVYPDEPPAIFKLEPFKLNVDNLYNGTRGNIALALKAIAALETDERKYASYADLLDLMAYYGHIPGKEIFNVGSQMKLNTRNSSSSPVFQKLPVQVQLIMNSTTTSNYLKLYFISQNNQTYVMNGSTAYQERISTYPYSIYEDRYDKYTLEYLFNKYIGISTNSRPYYMNIATSARSWEIHLAKDLKSFHLVNPDYAQTYCKYEFTELNSAYRFCIDCQNAVDARFLVTPYELELAKLYNSNDRRVIFDLLKFINASLSDSVKSVKYVELLSLMEAAGHIPGKEIFVVGVNIKEQLGIQSIPFGLLPQQVQFITSGQNVSLAYRRNGVDYPLKYSWASDAHEEIKPYRFKNNVLSDFALIYGSGSSERKLYLNSDKFLLDIEYTGVDSFHFELSLDQGLNSFSMFSTGTTTHQLIGTINKEPEFFFRANSGTSANWSVKAY